MANIPIANIPNAPQTGNNAVLTDPSAIRPPNFRRGGAMIAEGVNMLRQEKLPAAAFDAGGMGAGLEALGDAGSNAAAAFGDFAVRLGRANDEAQMTYMDDIKTDVLSRFEEETLTKSPDQWGNIWTTKYEPQLVDKISKLPMSSPLSASRRDAALKSLRLQTAAQVRSSSTKALVGNYRQGVINTAQRAFNEGRIEDSMAFVRRGVASGLLSDEEGEKMIIGFEEDGKVATMTQAIQQNPAQWRGELAKYQKEGKNPHKLRPEQVLQFRRMAEGTHAQLVDDLNNEMLNRLETDSAAITNDQIEEFYTRPDIDAPRELINKMKEYRGFKYADTPEGQAEQATRFSDLWQKIFSYNAEKDISMADPDTHKREYQRLISEIVTTAPEGQRKPFMDTLDGMVSQANQGQKSRTDEITRQLIDVADKLAEMDQFGRVGDWKKEERGDKTVMVPKDSQAWLNVQTKRLEVVNEVRRLMRENPDITEEQAMERFKSIVEPKLDAGSSFMNPPQEQTWGDWFNSWFGAVVSPLENNPNVMTAGFSLPNSGGGMLDNIERMNLSQSAFQVTDQTRDQIGSKSTPQARQVSLDFNSGAAQSRGVEIVVPANATPDERAAAQEYTTALTAWFKSKGVEVPNRGVLAKTGRGKSVSRFHTEPFFIQDAESRKAIEADPDGYARVLVATLGRLPVTFIAPHTLTDGGAEDGDINERDFARTVIIPALRRVQGGDAMLVSN
jgi:hypothetical protein